MQSFYCPRSHPGSRAITVHCLDPGTVTNVTIEKVDGVNWEQTFAKRSEAKRRQDAGVAAKG